MPSMSSKSVIVSILYIHLKWIYQQCKEESSDHFILYSNHIRQCSINIYCTFDFFKNEIAKYIAFQYIHESQLIHIVYHNGPHSTKYQ